MKQPDNIDRKAAGMLRLIASHGLKKRPAMAEYLREVATRLDVKVRQAVAP